jgi:ABC-2 type transport system permease protein
MKRLLSYMSGSKFGWLLFIVIIIFINILGSSYKFRMDLTAEKRFSLSAPTKRLLRNLDSTVTIDVLLKGEFPSSFRKLQNSTRELLAEMKEYGGQRLQFRFINPLENSADSVQTAVYDSLEQMGIMPYTLQVTGKAGGEKSERVVFPAAVVKYNDKTTGIDLLAGKVVYKTDPVTGTRVQDEAASMNNAETLLEFKFADAIEKIQRKKLPKVAYIIGNGEPVGPEVTDLGRTMTGKYSWGIIDINQYSYIPATVDAILIVKPTKKFEDSTKIKIDQYVMQGGKVMWFLDNLDANKDSLAHMAETVAFDLGLNLDDILFRYGVRINRDLVQDLQCDRKPIVVGNMGGQPQIQPLPFNYYPLLTTSSKSSITRNMEPVLSEYANSIDTVKADGVTKTILLSTSENSKSVATPAMISLAELQTYDNPKLYTKKFQPVAVLLEGKFRSAFANRTPASVKAQLESDYKAPYLDESRFSNKMIVVSDGDIVLNKVAQDQELPMGLSNSRQTLYANRSFLLNSLEYLTSTSGILETRNKDIVLRLLDKLKVEEERTTWQIINIALPILIIILFGFIYQYWRKRRYS